MICPNCRRETPKDLNYCIKCGCNLKYFTESDSQLLNDEESSNKIESAQNNDVFAGQRSAAVLKKPQNKYLPFIIIGCILLCTAIGLCCKIFFGADIAHAKMGNNKYAASLAKKTINSFINSEYLDSCVYDELSALIYSDYEDIQDCYDNYINAHPNSDVSIYQYYDIIEKSKLLSKISWQLPDCGIYIKAGANAELSDRFYETLSENSGADAEKIKKAADELNSIDGEIKFSVDEDGIDFGYLIYKNEDKLDSGNVYYNTTNGNLYYLNADMCDYPLVTRFAPLEISPKNNDYTFMSSLIADARGYFCSDLADIYSKYVKKAKTLFYTITEEVGGCEFDGRVMSVTFENNVLTDMLGEIIDSYYDSTFFQFVLMEVYGDRRAEIDNNQLINELKENAKTSIDRITAIYGDISLTVNHYVNKNNTIAGLSVTTASKNSESENTAWLEYINTKTNFYVGFSINDTAYIKCEGTKTGLNSGNAQIEVNITPYFTNDEVKNLQLSVEYDNLSQKEILGKKQLLGNFKINANGNMLDNMTNDILDYIHNNSVFYANDYDHYSEVLPAFLGLIIKDTEFTISVQKIDNGVQYTVNGENKDYGKVSCTVQMGENTDPVLDRENITEGNAVNTGWDNLKALNAEISALTHISKLCRQSVLIRDYFSYCIGEDFIENIDKKTEELENSRKYKEVYSNYNENKTADNANILAYELRKNLAASEMPIVLTSKEPVTVKIYYDAAGKMNIIDMAGEDEELLKSIKNLRFSGSLYKNVYVEIIYCCKLNQYAPVGITAVMTDNMNNIPNNLPSVYNFIDKVYPWENKDNYIDAYVVGTYPELAKGDSTYKEELKVLADEVDRYNDYAKRGFEVFDSFLKETGNSLNPPPAFNRSSSERLSFEIESGEWSLPFNSYFSSMFKNEISKEVLLDYMREKLPDIKDGWLFILKSEEKAVGASFAKGCESVSPSALMVGVSCDWGLIDGLYPGYPKIKGTYPVIKYFDGTLSEDVISFFTGTWVNRDDEKDILTITREDLSNIISIGNGSSDSILLIINLSGSIKYMYFDLPAKLSYNRKTYFKQSQ